MPPCLPLAAVATPENPPFPIASNIREPSGSAQIFGLALAIQPKVARDAGATSPCSGGADGVVQSGLVVLPTPCPHWRHRPMVRYPNARVTSNGAPFFMTW